MFLVTVLRWPASPDEAATRLAARLGKSAYEARSLLSGVPPKVVAAVAEPGAAEELARGLTADGLSATLLAASDVEQDSDREIAASLAFGDVALEAAHPGRTRRIPSSPQVGSSK